MNRDLAEENLQTIRLLMERASVYRRALAPIMLMAGVCGIGAAVVGVVFQIENVRSFAALWLGTAVVVITLAFLLVRQQAFRAQEAFWSPPTCRVAHALIPPFLSGAFISAVLALPGGISGDIFMMLLVWLFFYGCGLHAAGFFMVRGMRWFGWVFIVSAVLLTGIMLLIRGAADESIANWLMGGLFGGLHLAYGIYLYFTEKSNTPAIA